MTDKQQLLKRKKELISEMEYVDEQIRNSTKQCPKCGSPRIFSVDLYSSGFNSVRINDDSFYTSQDIFSPSDKIRVVFVLCNGCKKHSDNFR